MDKKRNVRKRTRRKPFLYVREVKHGWMWREIHLAGDVETVIAYNCRAECLGLFREPPRAGTRLPPLTGGAVRVNGVELGPLREEPPGSGGAAAFAVRFSLGASADRLRAELRADLFRHGLIHLQWLQLLVNGVPFYEERDGETVVLQARSDLPLPAARGDAAGEGLPIPGEAGEGEY